MSLLPLEEIEHDLHAVQWKLGVDHYIRVDKSSNIFRDSRVLSLSLIVTLKLWLALNYSTVCRGNFSSRSIAFFSSNLAQFSTSSCSTLSQWCMSPSSLRATLTSSAWMAKSYFSTSNCVWESSSCLRDYSISTLLRVSCFSFRVK